MTIENQHIETLLQAVVATAGHTVETSSDFIRLSGQIEGRLGETLGVSTLKRIFGRLAGGELPRQSTLDLLARFCGHADYLAFVADVCGIEDYATSHVVHTTALPIDRLEQGTMLVLEWNPDRRLLVEHNGVGYFTVRQSRSSKLRIGDTFHCDRMLAGEPCYVDHLVHEGAASPYYVMGLRGGLTKIEQVEAEQ